MPRALILVMIAIGTTIAAGGALTLLKKPAKQPNAQHTIPTVDEPQRIVVKKVDLNHEPSKPAAKKEPEPREPKSVEKAPSGFRLGLPFAARPLAAWKITIKNPQKVEAADYIDEMRFSPDGKTLMVRTVNSLSFHDTMTGKVQHTFDTDFFHSTIVNRACTLMGVMHDKSDGITFYSAQTGSKVSDFTSRECRFYKDYPGAVSIQGDTYYQWSAGYPHHPNEFYRLNMRTGKGEPVGHPKLPDRFLTKSMVVNAEETHLFCTEEVSSSLKQGGKVSTLSLETGRVTALRSATVDPFAIKERPIQLNATGNLLVIANPEAFQVIDWKQDKEMCEVKAEGYPTFSHPRFTSKNHVVVIWEPNHFLIGPKGSKNVPYKLQLYNGTTGHLLREHEFEDTIGKRTISCIELTDDGKQIAVAFGFEVKLYNFSDLFKE